MPNIGVDPTTGAIPVVLIVLAIVALVIFEVVRRRVTPKTKRCPDCAELVLADARICRFCGHNFSPPYETGAR